MMFWPLTFVKYWQCTNVDLIFCVWRTKFLLSHQLNETKLFLLYKYTSKTFLDVNIPSWSGPWPSNLNMIKILQKSAMSFHLFAFYVTWVTRVTYCYVLAHHFAFYVLSHSGDLLLCVSSPFRLLCHLSHSGDLLLCVSVRLALSQEVVD